MKKTTISLIMLVFFPLLSSSADAEEINLRFDKDKMSADFENVPLEKVLEKLGNEKHIWYRCEKSKLGEKVSARFQDLTMEDGMRKILSPAMNYGLVFDQKSQLRGIVIVDKGSSLPSDGYPPGFEVIHNKPPPEKTVKLTPEQEARFEVKENSPPPGGAHKLEDLPEDVRERFRVIPDCPPGSDCGGRRPR